MAGRFEPNTAAIQELLYGASGPVYQHLVTFAERVEGAAKAVAPVESGKLRASIDTSKPVRSVGSLNLTVGSDVRDEEGATPYYSYALVAHQGHGVIRPRKKKAMKFLPKGARGTNKFVYAKKIRATPGKPYLTFAVKVINQTLPADVQFELIPGDDVAG